MGVGVGEGWQLGGDEHRKCYCNCKRRKIEGENMGESRGGGVVVGVGMCFFLVSGIFFSFSDDRSLVREGKIAIGR